MTCHVPLRGTAGILAIVKLVLSFHGHLSFSTLGLTSTASSSQYSRLLKDLNSSDFSQVTLRANQTSGLYRDVSLRTCTRRASTTSRISLLYRFASTQMGVGYAGWIGSFSSVVDRQLERSVCGPIISFMERLAVKFTPGTSGRNHIFILHTAIHKLRASLSCVRRHPKVYSQVQQGDTTCPRGSQYSIAGCIPGRSTMCAIGRCGNPCALCRGDII